MGAHSYADVLPAIIGRSAFSLVLPQTPECSIWVVCCTQSITLLAALERISLRLADITSTLGLQGLLRLSRRPCAVAAALSSEEQLGLSHDQGSHDVQAVLHAIEVLKQRLQVICHVALQAEMLLSCALTRRQALSAIRGPSQQQTVLPLTILLGLIPKYTLQNRNPGAVCARCVVSSYSLETC